MSVLLTNCPSDPSSLDLGSNGSKLSEARNGSRRTDDESNPPFELLCLSSSLGMMLYVELLVGPIAKRKLPGGAGGGGERSLVPVTIIHQDYKSANLTAMWSSKMTGEIYHDNVFGNSQRASKLIVSWRKCSIKECKKRGIKSSNCIPHRQLQMSSCSKSFSYVRFKARNIC